LGGLYYIISGSKYNEGSIITRGIDDVPNIYSLNNEERYYIVQTNYDR